MFFSTPPSEAAKPCLFWNPLQFFWTPPGVAGSDRVTRTYQQVELCHVWTYPKNPQKSQGWSVDHHFFITIFRFKGSYPLIFRETDLKDQQIIGSLRHPSLRSRSCLVWIIFPETSTLTHYSDIVSDIPSWSIYGIYIYILTFYLTLFLAYTVTFYLTFFLAYYLTSILTYFLAYIRISFWHSICHIFVTFFLAYIPTFCLTFLQHFVWQSFWQSIWHSFWHSIWHSIWPSLWHFSPAWVRVQAHSTASGAEGGAGGGGGGRGEGVAPLLKSRDPVAGGEAVGKNQATPQKVTLLNEKMIKIEVFFLLPAVAGGESIHLC